MIIGNFHQGSGIGNQLHRYVMTRVLALDKGYEWGMLNSEFFKGSSFMNLDMGKENNIFFNKEFGKYQSLIHPNFYKVFDEKKVLEGHVDIRGYDPEINFVEDNTIIDGEFQDERYFEHRLPKIREWLKVEPLKIPDDVCVMNIRGGEYKVFPDLILDFKYWVEAMGIINKDYEKKFEIHTDDPEYCRQLFGDAFPIIQDMALNWRSIRYAKHLILSNSSFAILPALLNEDAREIIAPRYWARHNTKTWALPQNYYKKFTYI